FNERNILDKTIAHREAAKVLNMTPISYDDFIQKQSVKVLQNLCPEQLQQLYPAFENHIYVSGKGILQIQSEHKVEIQAFGNACFMAIANRESSQPYSEFVRRNGQRAISLITNTERKAALSESFVSHATGEKLGLRQTRD